MDKVCGRTIETHQVAQESSSSSSSSSSSLFRSKESTSSIPQTLSPNSTRLRSVVTQLLLRGATISPVLNEQVTHLVVDFENNYSIERERALQVNQNTLYIYSIIATFCSFMFYFEHFNYSNDVVVYRTLTMYIF